MFNRRSLFIVALLVAFIVIVPVYASVYDDRFALYLFSRIFAYALAAMSLDLLIGYGGMVSFGHATYVGLGAYGVGIASFHLYDGSAILGLFPGSENVLIVWPIVILCTVLAAVIIGAMCLRTRGIYFIMLTFAFAQMLFYLVNALRIYGGDEGMVLINRNQLPFIDTNNSLQFYFLALTCLCVWWYLSHRIVHSRFGMALMASKQNEQRIATLGVPVFRLRLTAFAIAGAGAALAGILLANQSEYIDPRLFGWHLSGLLIAIIVLGGIGSLTGSVVGVLVYFLSEQLISQWTVYWNFYFGILIIIIALFGGRGVIGMIGGRKS